MDHWVSRLAVLGMLLLTTSFVSGLTLREAKEAGWVGETTEGYLAAVGNPSPEVQHLIADINARRRAEYQAISNRTGAELSAVEALAGSKAINRTPPGQYIRLDNRWQTK